ncbi:MAG: hypothetical protein HY927_08790 [Elusimicrobia bacterium]|nr:hypothetical protein [Elusimicrobiota bacterium]
MPAQCRISSIELAEPHEAGCARAVVKLEDGKASTFIVATLDQPRRWTAESKAGFRLTNPVLFVRSLDEEAVAQAMGWMAMDMGGFWLRYYNSEKRPSPPSPSTGPASQAARGKKAS